MRTKDMYSRDEKVWRRSNDELEPLIGVPSVNGAPVPLPDTASGEPEPGLAGAQEDGAHSAGFDQAPTDAPED